MFDKINREKAIYEKKIILGYGMTALAFILFIPLSTAMGPGAFFLLAIPFLGGTFYAGQSGKKIKEISNRFKEEFVTQELQKLFPDSTYSSTDGFSESFVVDSGLLYKRDRYKSEDMITGEWDGVRFRCCDVEQKEVRKSGKSHTVVTVFQGRFYEFDFPKSFRYDLLLIQPFKYRPFSGLKKIKMESIEFNSELKVYAQSEHEAFYILTPHFMERLLQMDLKYMDKISFSFQRNKLFIAIDTREDYFDIKPFHPVSQRLIDGYQEELLDIKDFIETLKLNTTIFK